jgi:hypothetical protein
MKGDRRRQPGAALGSEGPEGFTTLQRKRRYDPSNLFHLNQNVEPAPPRASP